MGKKVSREIAWLAKQMYEEKDEKGRQKWTQLEIAMRLGVGETTVFRAIHNAARFSDEPLPEVKSSELLQTEVPASLEKFKKLLAEGKGESDTKEIAEQFDTAMQMHARAVAEYQPPAPAPQLPPTIPQPAIDEEREKRDKAMREFLERERKEREGVRQKMQEAIARNSPDRLVNELKGENNGSDER